METSSLPTSVTSSNFGIGLNHADNAATIEALPGQEETDAAMLQLLLLLSKIGSMLVLGLGSLLLGMMPLLIGRCRAATVADGNDKQRRPITSVSNTSNTTPGLGLLTSLLLCFGGGVLLFTTFLHLAPEVRIHIEQLQGNHQLPTLGELSLSELLFCAGFFFVYLVEETVHAALSSKPEILLYRTVSVRRCNNNNNNNNNGNLKNGHSNATSHQQQICRSDSSDDEERGTTTVPSGEHLQRRPTISKTPMFPTERHQHHHQVPNLKQQSHAGDNSMRSLLTVLALSFHAIFEGLTVGLETSLASVFYLAGAIATHKLVISFCVGMELYCAGASQRALLGYLSIFAMVTPLGIGIGLALAGTGQQGDGPMPTILQAMAAGTLLYVVFFEVLARERANDKSGLLQLTAILVGFFLMLALQLVTAHSHSHEHSHESHDPTNEGVHDHDHDHAENTVNHFLESAIERTTAKVTEFLSSTMA
ncbi:hypothetical protein QAD02_018127 [Eretmocerus hayati]|uniref:Uncharacterized protein n=1 Tax=Eretmocerus hayati TaxID=131215 RepID=A0ACC2PKN6_9HYME|nr:hypothetical protein QAD02_018127 [Eretmocerus hayati]